MKTKLQSSFSPAIALAVALLVLASSSAAEKKQSTTVGLKEVQKSLGELQVRVSDTISALTELKNAPKQGADLSSKHATFTKQFEQLQSLSEQVRKQGTQMRSRAEEHYKAWQEELTKMGNPKLREKAQNRYADAKEEFDEIIVIAEEAKREMDPFMADLRDVSTYLNTDLSKDSLKTLSNTIWKLENKSRAVIGSLQHVSTQINRALDELPENR